MHIIESVGSWGVRTTPIGHRMFVPRPGDIVRFGDELRRYPISQELCRIERIDDKRVILVDGMGSAFLHECGSLSISGGPFFSLPLESLKPTGDLHQAIFWNWGDNSPGPGHGVEYHLRRPVFLATIHPNDKKGTEPCHAE